MKPLSPSQKSVLRIRGAIAALPFLAASLFFETVIRDAGLPLGFALSPALLLAAFLILYAPPRRYRSWGYDVTEDELHVESGIWLRTRTVVPFGRVQHIDVGQGPVERRYGLGTLTLHTAGTRGSAVSLPGLELGDAERMRDEIRAQIRQDLV
ncbi:MAG TPA: PH domain-containing protein [Allosphingosinicella sp.]